MLIFSTGFLVLFVRINGLKSNSQKNGRFSGEIACPTPYMRHKNAR
jgi:hypothetical protein